MVSRAEEVVAEAKVLYEREVQHFLAKNLFLLGEPRLELVRLEYPVSFGRIDLVARDSHGRIVAIEVKRDAATRHAVGQLQSYMGALTEEFPHDAVRGILVAAGIDEGGKAAMLMTQNIELFEFRTVFEFTKRTIERPKPVKREAEGVFKENYWEKLGGTVLPSSFDCRKCEQRVRLVVAGGMRVCGWCGAPTYV